MDQSKESLQAKVAELEEQVANQELNIQDLEDHRGLLQDELAATGNVLRAIRACQRSTGSGGGHMQAIVEIDRLLTAASVE